MDQQNQQKSADLISSFTQERATESNAIQIPEISLPKGGGALKGIDEKFEVNAANGTAGFSIPLPVTPGRNNFSPALSLSYNSGGGNSPYGLGWSVSYPMIQRRTDKQLPRYRDGLEYGPERSRREDTFLYAGADDLVPYLQENESGDYSSVIIEENGYTVKRYRPRMEGGFDRIEKIRHHTHGTYWKVTTRDNIATVFGRSKDARIANPEDESKIFQWMPEFSYDDKGNWIKYTYKQEDLDNVSNEVYEQNRRAGIAPFTNIYLKSIQYGNRKAWYADPGSPYDPPAPIDNEHFFELIMDYGEHDSSQPTPQETLPWEYRSDAFSSYRSGFEIRTNRLCKRILMFHHFEDEQQFVGTPEEEGFGENYLVRSLDLDYEPSSINSSGRSETTYLKSITQSGYIRKPDGMYSKKSLPPMEFTYEKLNWSKTIKKVSPENMVNAPVGLTNNYQWVDLYGEGISGILTEKGEGWYYKSNLGDVDEHGDVSFSTAQKVILKPSFSGLSNGALSLQDLAANGEKQVVVNSDGLQGYFELAHDNIWKPFKSFAQVTNIDFQDPNTRFLDLNGDGQPEIVITEENVFTWYAADGKRGHLPAEQTAKAFDEERGPTIVFADKLQTIFLADMSGDGLTDLVRIRNGEVCYWANKGYGRFSAKINMGNAPTFDHPDSYDPKCLHLADVSGTGATDIIYLGKNKFKAFINLSGNAWSDAHEIEPFLPVSNNVRLSVVDLLGAGTSCIVWSSDLPSHANAPMRYIDLMDSRKPHVLVHYKNNLGKENSLQYKSSTHYYLTDKMAGNPWITKLPFPVQVVCKSIVEEKITDVRFTSEYRYHHGYYDHHEREFRGFGMVEQTDTEEYNSWKANNAGNQLVKSKDLYQSPVLTKTWFHTGAFLDKETILTHFKDEYWFEVFNKRFPSAPLSITEPELPDAHLSEDIQALEGDEFREALRACKGMMLRQEVFALDGEESDLDSLQRQAKPYSVATHTCLIKLLQLRGDNRYAVFMPVESETLSIQYERDETDPRISHTLNITIDDLGNVLEAASVVYPRQYQAGLNSFDILRDEARALTYERIEERETYLDSLRFLETEQQKILITFTQNDFTDDLVSDDLYRLRLPAGTRTYEITGLPPSGMLFQPVDFAGILEDPERELAYHESPGSGSVIPRYRLIEHIQSTYYNDDLTTELEVGLLGRHGIPRQSYQLAYTPDLLSDIFGTHLPADAAQLENLLSDNDHNTDGDNTYSQCRFVHRSDDNWWIRSGTTQFYLNLGEELSDIEDRFFTPQCYLDPLGFETRVTYYRDYYMMIDSATDDLGNQTGVEHFNFRTLSPMRMSDINNNISGTVIDELGLVKAMALMGKGTEADNLQGITEFTPEAQRERIRIYFTDSDTESLQRTARDLLQQATTRFVYNFDRYQTSATLREEQLAADPDTPPCTLRKLLPAVAGSIIRERHHSDDPESPLQLSFEYTGGTGQVVMVKSQAEPGEALNLAIQPNCDYTLETVDTGDDLRWIGNSRSVLNNKGNPVKQYEPYFSVNPFYEDAKELVERGVTPIIFYDAMGRNIRTELPDGTFTQVEFDAWQQRSYDQNDTVLESRWHDDRISGVLGDAARESAEKASEHHNTPDRLHLDTLGRPVLTVAHNRWQESQTEEPPVMHEELYATWVELDIEGNARAVKDARGNTVMSWKYDMLGHRVYQESMDAGRRWMLNNVAGNPIRHWDERGNVLHYAYDVLQRPLTTYIIGGDGDHPLDHTIIRTIYGEGQPGDRRRNLRGQVYRQYDASGLLQNEQFDFKGNLLEARRQLAADYDVKAIDWPVSPPDSMLEREVFFNTTEYDALNRMVRMDNWHSDRTRTGVYRPFYNARGLLQSENFTLAGTTTPAIGEIKYNVKGQRTHIRYGNSTVTRYYYDPKTFRLLQLRTTRPGYDPGFPEYHSGLRDNQVLQQLSYTYDPVGNITEIYDEAYQPVFFNNQEILPQCRYVYDSQYRLIEATGRENSSFNQTPRRQEYPVTTVSFPVNDSTASRNYIQRYRYDAAGNILRMRHRAGRGSFTERWTRNYAYATDSNRLLHTFTNSDSVGISYHYNAHGSMLNMLNSPNEFHLTRDYRDMIRHVHLGGGGNAFYNYDSDKQRTRKRIERLDGTIEERIYLEGMEVYRRRQGSDTMEAIETHHLFAGDQRVLMVEDVRTSGTTDLPEATLFRYQYGNHLGSVGMELNADTEVITYEEYHPYGTNAYRAKEVAVRSVAKRYRYTGMERDEETGLNYHTARYYLPWIGRWGSADPIGLEGGMNLYVYGSNDPLSMIDKTGERVVGWDFVSGMADDFENMDTRNMRTARGHISAFLEDYLLAVPEAEQAFFTLRENEIVLTRHAESLIGSGLWDEFSPTTQLLINAVRSGITFVADIGNPIGEGYTSRASHGWEPRSTAGIGHYRYDPDLPPPGSVEWQNQPESVWYPDQLERAAEEAEEWVVNAQNETYRRLTGETSGDPFVGWSLYDLSRFHAARSAVYSLAFGFDINRVTEYSSGSEPNQFHHMNQRADQAAEAAEDTIMESIWLEYINRLASGESPLSERNRGVVGLTPIRDN